MSQAAGPSGEIPVSPGHVCSVLRTTYTYTRTSTVRDKILLRDKTDSEEQVDNDFFLKCDHFYYYKDSERERER